MADLENFNSLWDYNDPAGTEVKFQALLPAAEQGTDRDALAQLLTQIARTYSLRGKFTEAHMLLDRAASMFAEPATFTVSRVRYLLERGRTFNSSGDIDRAMTLFQKAFETALEINEPGYAIDALHMIAIAERDPARQIEWNLKGIAMAEANPSAAGWLHALYNNIGESYAALGKYETAYEYFHKLAELQRARRGEADMYTLKDEARMLRLAGQPERSLEIVEPIFSRLAANGSDDGWIREELAEALHATGATSDAKHHFVKAFEMLREDSYCLEYEKARLLRLEEMAS